TRALTSEALWEYARAGRKAKRGRSRRMRMSLFDVAAAVEIQALLRGSSSRAARERFASRRDRRGTPLPPNGDMIPSRPEGDRRGIQVSWWKAHGASCELGIASNASSIGKYPLDSGLGGVCFRRPRRRRC